MVDLRGRLEDTTSDLEDTRGRLEEVGKQHQDSEKVVKQQQLSLASNSQKHKTEILKFEDQQKQLESSLSDAKRSAKVLAQELEKKREVITKKDAELSSAKDNIKMKVDEVKPRNCPLLT